MLAAVCRACVVSGGSAAMQLTVGGRVYAVYEQNCTIVQLSDKVDQEGPVD